MKPYARSDRVAGQIQKVLSDALHKRIKDPRLKHATITGVKLSRDLRLARVYFVTSGDKKHIEETIQGFESAGGFVKRTIARQLGLRYMPEIIYHYDDTLEHGARIEKLFKQIEAEHGKHHSASEG
jgi:ribosome-binding factor A